MLKMFLHNQLSKVAIIGLPQVIQVFILDSFPIVYSHRLVEEEMII